jgi:hypothetical protein
LRWLATIYGGVVGLLALWAWYVDLELQHSEREHLVPDILLAIATMPSSLSGPLLYRLWPDTFTGLYQLAHLTACAMFQTTILFLLASRGGKRDV